MKTFDECKYALVFAQDKIASVYKPAEGLAAPWHQYHREAMEALRREYSYVRSDGGAGTTTLRIDHFNPDPEPSVFGSSPPGWRASVGLRHNDHDIYPGRRADSTDYRELLRVQQLAENWMAGVIDELPPSTGLT